MNPQLLHLMTEWTSINSNNIYLKTLKLSNNLPRKGLKYLLNLLLKHRLTADRLASPRRKSCLISSQCRHSLLTPYSRAIKILFKMASLTVQK